MQVMCKYSRELFLSNYILFSCIHVSTHKKRQKDLDLYWTGQKNKLKRAIDQPMVIRISESGIWNSGIFLWNLESLALEFND